MIDGREKINDISSRCWYFSRLSSELSPFTAAPRPISDGWKKRAGLLDDKLRQKKVPPVQKRSREEVGGAQDKTRIAVLRGHKGLIDGGFGRRIGQMAVRALISRVAKPRHQA